MSEQPSFWDCNERGLSFYKRQAYDLAIAEFERAVNAATFPLATLDLNLGAAYLGRGMYTNARAWLEKGVALDPDNAMGHWLLAQALKAIGALFEACAEFEQVYALDPGSPEGLLAEEEILNFWARCAPFPHLET